MNKNLLIALVFFYNITIIIGTAYIVFGLGRSGWWWILAFLLLVGVKDKS